MRIVLDNVSKAYGGKQILKTLSCSINSSEITTLVAPNGTGKSTLLSVISGIVKADSGTVCYDGLREKKDVGIVLAGEKNLYMKNTVKENLVYFGVLQGMTENEVANRIEKYKLLFPLYEAVKDKLAEELSYGQKRLIAIFSTIITEQKCILIDEATEGLDLQFVSNLVELLKQISKERIVILASHDYMFISKVSDRIIFLQDGELEEYIEDKDEESIRNRYCEKYGLETGGN